jgi:hypothetical protein
MSWTSRGGQKNRRMSRTRNEAGLADPGGHADDNRSMADELLEQVRAFEPEVARRCRAGEDGSPVTSGGLLNSDKCAQRWHFRVGKTAIREHRPISACRAQCNFSTIQQRTARWFPAAEESSARGAADQPQCRNLREAGAGWAGSAGRRREMGTLPHISHEERHQATPGAAQRVAPARPCRSSRVTGVERADRCLASRRVLLGSVAWLLVQIRHVHPSLAPAEA